MHRECVTDKKKVTSPEIEHMLNLMKFHSIDAPLLHETNITYTTRQILMNVRSKEIDGDILYALEDEEVQ